MKKVLGLILTFAFLFTFVQAFDWMTNAPAANAQIDTGGGASTGGGIPDAGAPGLSGSVTQNTNQTPPTSEKPPGGSCPTGVNCGTTIVIPDPYERAYCNEWPYNAGYYTDYPINAGRNCTVNIGSDAHNDAQQITCPPNSDGVSAIYAEYKENQYYVSKFKDISSIVKSWPAPVQIVPGMNFNYGGEGWRAIAMTGTLFLTGTNGAGGANLPWTLGTPNMSMGTGQYTYSTAAARGFYNFDIGQAKNPYSGTKGGFFNQAVVGIFAQSLTPQYAIPTVECKYPVKVSPDTEIYPVTCFTSYDSFLYQADKKATIQNGGAERGRRINLRAGSIADINNPNNYGVTIANHMGCFTEVFNTYQDYKYASPENGGYGYYRLQINLRAVTCQVTGYPLWTGNRSQDKIASCGNEQPYGSYKFYGAYSCQGNDQYTYANLPDNMNFSVSACIAFNCDITGETTINGTNGDLQVMRNGENLKITYPTIRVTDGTGSANQPDPSLAKPENGAANWSDVTFGGTGVVSGSSPYKGTQGTAAVNNSKQYFGLRTVDNKKVDFLQATSGPVSYVTNSPASAWQPQSVNGVANGDFLNGNVNFNWASAKGKSWQMFRTFRINGEFWVPVASSTSAAPEMAWQHESKYCGEVKSGKVTVVRSVNELK